MSDGISATGSVTAGSSATSEMETTNGFAHKEARAMQAQRLNGVRRGLLRSARALATAALLALVGALALPATAEAEVLVSNLMQPVTGSGNLNLDQAQAFTTGAAHRLTSVKIQFSYIGHLEKCLVDSHRWREWQFAGMSVRK